MHHRVAWLAASIVLGIAGLFAHTPVAVESESTGGPHCSTEEARAVGDDFPWSEQGPLAYLKMLTRRGRAGGLKSNFYTVCGVHSHWVHEQDLPELMKLLDSREPCAHTVLSISSYVPLQQSFVGQEALFLIEGFRQGTFPPGRHSAMYSAQRREAVEAWWRSRNRAR